MRILIEEYKYEAQDVKDILHGIDALETVEGRVSLNYVGYFYNTQLKDCVFILPKVLLEDKDDQELVFGHHDPKDIINLDEKNPLSETEKKFIYEFFECILRKYLVLCWTHIGFVLEIFIVTQYYGINVLFSAYL